MITFYSEGTAMSNFSPRTTVDFWKWEMKKISGET